MRKAVCKNNRQQVVFKKVIDLKELLGRTVVAVGLRGLGCVRNRAEESWDVFYSRSPLLIAFNQF